MKSYEELQNEKVNKIYSEYRNDRKLLMFHLNKLLKKEKMETYQDLEKNQWALDGTSFDITVILRDKRKQASGKYKTKFKGEHVFINGNQFTFQIGGQDYLSVLNDALSMIRLKDVESIIIKDHK